MKGKPCPWLRAFSFDLYLYRLPIPQMPISSRAFVSQAQFIGNRRTGCLMISVMVPEQVSSHYHYGEKIHCFLQKVMCVTWCEYVRQLRTSVVLVQ